MSITRPHSSTTTSTTSTTTTTTGSCSIYPSIDGEISENLLEIVKIYEKCIGSVTNTVLDLLGQYLEIMPPEYIRYALTETSFAPAPSLRYFRAIIRRLMAEQPTADDLRKDNRKPVKTVREQQYTQREYSNQEGMTSRMSERLAELRARS